MKNIYVLLNKAIEYIEENLEENIDYAQIAKILGMNEYMAQTTFSVLCDASISDYIRKRRLSNAGCDLLKTQSSIMDIAVKYKYTSATAFSRAFKKFHGVKPSEVKNKDVSLKVYSKIVFDNVEEKKESMEYKIIEKNEIVLYGRSAETTTDEIGSIAPVFFQKEQEKYLGKYGEFDYGMTSYEDRFNSTKCKYWVVYDKKIENKDFTKIVIPASRWIVITINSYETKDIQEATQRFYKEFVVSTKYELKPFPELEYYHDGITEFMIPIV